MIWSRKKNKKQNKNFICIKVFVIILYFEDFGIVFYIYTANTLSLYFIRIGSTILGAILKDVAKCSILISLTNS